MSKDPAIEAIKELFADLVEESTGIVMGPEPGQYLLDVEIVREDHLRFKAFTDNRQDFEVGDRGYIDIVITSWAQSADDIALSAMSTARALASFRTAP